MSRGFNNISRLCSTDTSKQCSSIVDLRDRAKDLKGGSGFKGFLKGVIFAKRNEDILAGMKDDMAKAVQMFKVRRSSCVFLIPDVGGYIFSSVDRYLLRQCSTT